MDDVKETQLAQIIKNYFIDFYRVNRFRLDIPLPVDSHGNTMSDSQIDIWLQNGWSLYYRPSTAEASFVELMDSFSSTSSWTSSQMKIFSQANWHEAKNGYWFWADVARDPAKLVAFQEISDNDLIKLPTIEEYIIIHFSTDFPNPFIRDYPKWLEEYSWLSTHVENIPLIAKSGVIIKFSDNQKAYPRFVQRHIERYGA